MKKFAAGLALTVSLCSLAPAMAGVRDLNTVKVGDIIPAFKGRSLTGEEVDVGALIGKKVLVLSFWSIYCKPCVEEISSLIRLQEQVGERQSRGHRHQCRQRAGPGAHPHLHRPFRGVREAQDQLLADFRRGLRGSASSSASAFSRPCSR